MKDRTLLNTRGFVWRRGLVPKAFLTELQNTPSGNMNLSSGFLTACQTGLNGVMPDARLNRATLFAKSPERSWSLGWHQDRVIAVKEKFEVSGYSNWTRKHDVWHVEPPTEVLNKMLFVQVYFDPVTKQDGPTELAINSHTFGKVLKARTKDVISNTYHHLCLAKLGDMLICQSLTLHRSLASLSQRPRRIFRMDFANFNLPKPLSWSEPKYFCR